MTTHTPAPWKDTITDEGLLIIDLRPQAKGYADIIVIGDLEDTDGEDHANARLIAAAPDLIAALQAIEKGLQDGSIKFTKQRQADSDPYHPANVLMNAALTKATEGNQ